MKADMAAGRGGYTIGTGETQQDTVVNDVPELGGGYRP